MKILLLEDDEILLETIQELLELKGYIIDIAKDGDEALNLTLENSYSLYIFDINVPKINGFKLLELLRGSEDSTPTIYITALVDIKSISQGFNIGASDYIKKPFHPDELILRIQNLLQIPDIKKYGDIKLKDRRVFKKGLEIHLTEIQFSIFSELIENIGKVVENSHFYEITENNSSSSLRFHINKLRNILGVEIKNIRSVGYMFEEI